MRIDFLFVLLVGQDGLQDQGHLIEGADHRLAGVVHLHQDVGVMNVPHHPHLANLLCSYTCRLFLYFG